MFRKLQNLGYQVEAYYHAEAILKHDLIEAAEEIIECLESFRIPVQDLVAGGGGESKGTQVLRRKFASLGWNKHEFRIGKTIDGIERESISHEIDHVKQFGNNYHTIALEIEWNNKDPFFDRDLENFKRLHADGAISVGIIITRGLTLHDGMRELIQNFAESHKIQEIADLAKYGYEPTSKQRDKLEKSLQKNPNIAEVWSKIFTSDKFGQATTHWRKLQDRVSRGVGNPCPLVLIGLPLSIITQ